MIFARELSAALRTNCAARICRGGSLRASNLPWFLGISAFKSDHRDFVKGAFRFCSSVGGWEETAPADQFADASNAVEEHPNIYRALAFPLSCHPLLPSNNISIVKDPVLLASLHKNRITAPACVSAFLLHEERLFDQGINNLEGEDLLDHIHEVGTVIKITRIQEDEAWLQAHCRVKIVDMVEDNPLIVRVVQLKDKDEYVSEFFSGQGEAYLSKFMPSNLQTYEATTVWFTLLSNMDFDEDNSNFLPDAVKLQKDDLSYLSDWVDGIASVMRLGKDLKQYLLEEPEVTQRANVVRWAMMRETKHAQETLSMLGNDHGQLLRDLITKVSTRQCTLSDCRKTLHRLMKEAEEKQSVQLELSQLC